MNTAQDIIDRARKAGITLWREGDRLRGRGDAAALSELTPSLAAHKSKLLQLVPNRPSCGGMAVYDDGGLLTGESILALAGEADRLITAWCKAFQAAEDTRKRMLAARRRMAPMALPSEVELMRDELSMLIVSSAPTLNANVDVGINTPTPIESERAGRGHPTPRRSL